MTLGVLNKPADQILKRDVPHCHVQFQCSSRSKRVGLEIAITQADSTGAVVITISQTGTKR